MTAEPGLIADASRDDATPVAGIVWRVLLLVAFIMLTIPQWITQMGAGLDPSWCAALYLSAAKGLVHGRDFVFTYGPLGFALIPKEYGDVNLHAVALRLGLHLFWWTSVGVLLFRVKGYIAPLVFAATTAMSGIALDNDFNLILAGAMILTVTGFLVLAELDRRPEWAVPAAFIAGAAVLTKFNLGVACTGALGIWVLMRLARDHSPRVWMRLALLGLVYFGSMAAFFRAYSGPLDALWPFLRASRELASAYSTQMTSDDPASSGFNLMVSMLGLAALGLIVSLARRSAMAPAFAIMLFPMFVLYKGTVVRQSLGHFLSAWPVMVSLSALVLPAASRTFRTRIGATVAVALILVSGFWYAPTSVEKVVTRGAENWVALCKLDRTRAAMRAYDSKAKREQVLPDAFLERIGTAPVDIYPWETSYVWANDLNWRPRPVFQSYCAYTPLLDQMCADHYRGANAPKFIVYSHVAIDYEHPCIVDPRTWIEMLRWYDCVAGDGPLLLLQRREKPRWQGTQRLDVASSGFTKSYQPPDAGRGLTFIKVDFELSLLGKLQAMLYKVDPPLIRVEYKDGEPANHRLVWRNTAGGFLVSSLPRNIMGVVHLFQEGVADEVIGVSFHDPSGRLKPEFKITALKSGGDVVAPPAVATSTGGPVAR
ncbi:hypothetical protein [Paludisphaera mucosa]|uniref:Glycosyltransferase RgtA/B/C/D-like domain-containing protein n=1 Tax=Paludisphaera mucosa TaxID=3030827 RepID=A0ABT6F9G2_9BACT|nr:hypothetical protein [Paludisphaera mucosa]MDG3004033.1 hypothetical protein [Paludisphaera mucosa]